MPDDSLKLATAALGRLAEDVRSFTVEVKADEQLRSRKIKAIQRVMYVLVPSIALLVLMAITNFILLSRVQATAAAAKRTNDLIIGCFTPGTPCSATSAARTGEALNQIRQTQFVIAVCQRKNPVTDDPQGTRMVACIQGYYPTFTLPAHPTAKPTAKPTAPPSAKPGATPQTRHTVTYGPRTTPTPLPSAR